MGLDNLHDLKTNSNLNVLIVINEWSNTVFLELNTRPEDNFETIEKKIAISIKRFNFFLIKSPYLCVKHI